MYSDQQQRYHTNIDNSSIDDSENDSNNTIPGLQERTRDDSSSDQDSEYNHGDNRNNNQQNQHQLFPNSITIDPVTSEWEDDDTNGDEYDGNHEENDIPRLATRYKTAPLRLQGRNRTIQVETVTKEDTKEVPNKQPCNPRKRTTTLTSL